MKWVNLADNTIVPGNACHCGLAGNYQHMIVAGNACYCVVG